MRRGLPAALECFFAKTKLDHARRYQTRVVVVVVCPPKLGSRAECVLREGVAGTGSPAHETHATELTFSALQSAAQTHLHLSLSLSRYLSLCLCLYLSPPAQPDKTITSRVDARARSPAPRT